ncbi:helix-turn-helix domain-containing protein [Haloplanus litoreus]|uniref:Helix-turn-helix domain-containing protein n=1 Tax=Haloplanus litoreus TaxID=767515 RepID=A0ABD5ZXP3_9EURY
MTVREPVPHTTTEIELAVRDGDCFFVRLSAETGCLLRLEELIHRADGRLLQYFTVREVAPDDVLRMARDERAIGEARLVGEGPDGNLFQFVVAGPCVTATLADTGAITRDVSAAGGVGRVVATVPAHASVRAVVETFQTRHPESDLLARRERDRSTPVRTKAGVHTVLADRLTEKQYEALRTAYLSGYFAWPRESTAQECADALGIAQPTFSQHVRTAQHKVFTALFDPTGDDP